MNVGVEAAGINKNIRPGIKLKPLKRDLPDMKGVNL